MLECMPPPVVSGPVFPEYAGTGFAGLTALPAASWQLHWYFVAVEPAAVVPLASADSTVTIVVGVPRDPTTALVA